MAENVVVTHESRNEVPFSLAELFFSRTDSRGIIESGNQVFQRISQYSWPELYKKPHNIIRHPDMPKAVFYLLWSFLKQQKPIAAYVKNRAKDGRHYWVFAIATPIDGGYLSVRLKPSSDFFPIIQSAYQSILGLERDKGLSPKESAEEILAALRGLGFKSYDDFMSIAISKEITARNAALGKKKEPFLDCFSGISSQASKIIKETESIYESYEANRYVPLNLQIHSSQLGEEGKAIGVISSNFSAVSAEVNEEIKNFDLAAQDVFNQIYLGQFLLCVALIQGEVFEQFKLESTSGNENDKACEMELLNKQRTEYRDKASLCLNTILKNITHFEMDCQRMKKCATSLEVIRVMGKVNAANHSSHSGLNELIDELKTFQTAISERIKTIESYRLSMKFDTEYVIKQLNDILNAGA